MTEPATQFDWSAVDEVSSDIEPQTSPENAVMLAAGRRLLAWLAAGRTVREAGQRVFVAGYVFGLYGAPVSLRDMAKRLRCSKSKSGRLCEAMLMEMKDLPPVLGHRRQ